MIDPFKNNGTPAMTELVSRRLSVENDFGAVFTDMYARGYTDGLPVIPPTEPAVRAML
jgi:hypothetical protein